MWFFSKESKRVRQLEDQLKRSQWLIESLQNQQTSLEKDFVTLAGRQMSLVNAVRDAFGEKYFSQSRRQYIISYESILLNPALKPIYDITTK